jgi:hypothetical protein
MNLSIKELNELIYSLGITASKGIFVNKELNASLIDKLYSELNSKIAIQSDITDEVIDRVKSHYVSKFNAEQYDKERDILKNAIDEEVEPEYDGAGFTEDDRIVNGQYRAISNEDADEDAKQRDYSAFNNYADTIKQDEQRYNNKKLFTLNENR